MSACAICDQPCTPMADYDVPVCLHCDERMATVLAVGPMLVEPAWRLRASELFARIRAELPWVAA